MSVSQSVRVLGFGFFAAMVTVAIAQQSSSLRPGVRHDQPKGIMPADANFGRFRVSTDQGVFVVYDGAEAATARNTAIPQIAYWNDDSSEQLYFFDRLLLTLPDVAESVAALQRDLGIDIDPILNEKPELSEGAFTDVGAWRAATEDAVFAVMAGRHHVTPEGGVAANFWWNCGCEPMCHRPVDPLPTPLPGASPDSLLRFAVTGAGCGGPPDQPLDPFRNIHPLIDHLMVMEDDLLINHFDPAICPLTEVTDEVLTSVNGSTYVASGPIMLHRDGQELRTGSVSVTTADGSDAVGLQIVTTSDDGVVGPDPQWTLTQTMRLNGEELTFTGSIIVVEPSGNTYTLAGGWTYSATGGPVIDPSSDLEFQNTLGNMLAFDPPVVAGGGAPPGALLSIPANAATMTLNYLRDSRRAYTAPTHCNGPIYQDGSGQSCEDVNIPCQAKIPDIALLIDAMTDVSPAFKKCMKGRFGCGGSYRRQLRIRCDDSSSCGACGSAGGCNLMGRDIWYCGNPNSDSCYCAQIVFHEAAHSCGIGHSLQYYLPGGGCSVPDERACEIGFWFEDRCNELPGTVRSGGK